MIEEMIDAYLSINLPVEKIIQALKERYNMDEDQAIEYIEKYKNEVKEKSDI